MDAIFTILIYASYILGSLLTLFGVYSFVKQEVHWFSSKNDFTGYTIKGPEARKYALYYIFVGILWVLYAYLRANRILD